MTGVARFPLSILRRVSVWLFLVLLPLCVVSAQQTQHADLSSPHHTLSTFLVAQGAAAQRTGLLDKILDVPREMEAERSVLAMRLKRILDVRGLHVELQLVPKEAEFIDTLTGRHRYIPFPTEPRIYLERRGSMWLFSRQTTLQIPDMYDEVYPLGLSHLVDIFPRDDDLYLGLSLWQYAAVLLLFGLAWLIGRAASYILLFFIRRVLSTWELLAESKPILKRSANPAGLLITLVVVAALLPVIQLPAHVSRYMHVIVHAATMFMGVILIYRLVDLVGLRLQKSAERQDSRLNMQLVGMALKTLKFIVVLIGFIFILQNLNFDITALLAGVSIGGLALAFASQDTIRNVFGAVMIFADKPFSVGDYIVVDGINGVVEEISFRSTRIRTLEYSIVTIPNGRLADMTVDNLGLREFRRYSTLLGLQYDTAPEALEQFVAGVKRVISEHPKVWNNRDTHFAHFFEYADSSLNIMVSCFLDARSRIQELAIRHELNMSFLRLAHEIGVSYAFPTRSLHIESAPVITTGTIADTHKSS